LSRDEGGGETQSALQFAACVSGSGFSPRAFIHPSIFLLAQSASKQTKTQHDPFLLLRVSRFQTHQRESAWATFGVLLILSQA